MTDLCGHAGEVGLAGLFRARYLAGTKNPGEPSAAGMCGHLL